MIRHVSTVLLLTFLSIPDSFAQRLIEAEGRAAIINGASQLAREQAIKNAMHQAMLQVEARIDSTATTSNHVLIIESSRLNAAGTVENVEVLNERATDSTYYVRIRASVPRDKIRKPSAAARYRKKIAALQFDIINRGQTYDLPRIETELPREIIRRLENTGQYIGIDGSRYLANRQLTDARQIHRLANELGAQILITGTIRDVSVKREWLILQNRQLEIEFTLYDGLSGAQISHHRLSERVPDTGYFKNPVVVFSESDFYQSNFGKIMDRLLKRQIELLAADLDQIPFSAKVVQIEGKDIYFDAGLKSKVQTGDVLMTYRLNPMALNASNDVFLGFIEAPVASLTVIKVQPNFAIGTLETDKVKIHPGDIIRFGW